MTATTTPDTVRIARLQRRIVWALSAGQVLGGIGTGATISLGPLLIVVTAGSEGLSGLAATTGTLGAAVLAIPLARLAQSRGRRVSLTTGAILAALGGLLVIASAGLMSLPLLLVGLTLMGAAQALNLQARFAAADLAADRTRGRDLSLVVWSTTIGVVLGPNLFEPGEALGAWLGLPEMSGGFAISMAAQLVGIVLFLVFLRPDPLLTAAALATRGDDPVAPRPTGALRTLRHNRLALRAVVTIALSHAVMVSLMSMTSVHMTGHGSAMAIVGLTISLHMAGMYALAPVFGWLTDRWGARAVILGGQGLSALALVAGVLGSDSEAGVMSALILLGLGWSASTVAGSTLVTESVAPAERPRVQGASDTLMNLAGAIGSAAAGPVLAVIAFHGLAAVLLVPVAIVVVMQLRRAD
ncbi:MFS transporter [Marinactinospora thermotolerans]|uniref:Predicted arabinose efflux permease, MFS family n=1 Tax=Marinactinospora thermotolerans DSM 45154 TaxID=1122192 RepID=A0A1T4P6Y8_9ACTN|nr:MFS transporter [Marinactinospora thermotolerans]SJZ87345.1 Predicted arabinose efflux permease, MFS family [Marinactinospora thermotolerans DSM 45154]